MSDSEDETQDWSMLGKTDASVLKRGEKDYAPDGTSQQLSVLDQSRDAMYTALSHPRTHVMKSLIQGEWVVERGQTKVEKPMGTHFFKMGRSEKGVIWLTPEETVYLVQRGSMICYLNNKPMSVQAVCSYCFSHVSPAKILAYSYLKKLGYTVLPAGQKTYSSLSEDIQPFESRSFLSVITSRWHKSFAWRSAYSSYDSIFRDLRIIETSRPTDPEPSEFDYHVWKPATKLKKSDPPEPEYYLKVIDANNAKMPTLSETRALLANIPIRPSTKRSPITRIKEGRRTAVLAVVGSGMVNFVRLTDVDLDKSLYPRTTK